MISFRKKSLLPSYSKCNQTVTIYHRTDVGVERKVYNNAFLDYRKNWSIDKTGSKEVNDFLLVIPGEDISVSVGDKVLLGTGKEITVSEWPLWIPSKVSGLVVIKHVDPKFFKGKQCHIEAGG